jgi:hypothetical protein
VPPDCVEETRVAAELEATLHQMQLQYAKQLKDASATIQQLNERARTQHEELEMAREQHLAAQHEITHIHDECDNAIAGAQQETVQMQNAMEQQEQRLDELRQELEAANSRVIAMENDTYAAMSARKYSDDVFDDESPPADEYNDNSFEAAPSSFPSLPLSALSASSHLSVPPDCVEETRVAAELEATLHQMQLQHAKQFEVAAATVQQLNERARQQREQLERALQDAYGARRDVAMAQAAAADMQQQLQRVDESRQRAESNANDIRAAALIQVANARAAGEAAIAEAQRSITHTSGETVARLSGQLAAMQTQIDALKAHAMEREQWRREADENAQNEARVSADLRNQLNAVMRACDEAEARAREERDAAARRDADRDAADHRVAVNALLELANLYTASASAPVSRTTPPTSRTTTTCRAREREDEERARRLQSLVAVARVDTETAKPARQRRRSCPDGSVYSARAHTRHGCVVRCSTGTHRVGGSLRCRKSKSPTNPKL